MLHERYKTCRSGRGQCNLALRGPQGDALFPKTRMMASINASFGRGKGGWAGQHHTLQPGAIVTMLAMGLIEQRFDHPVLRRYIPYDPCIARDMVAAANMANIGVADWSGQRHASTLSPLPPKWRQFAPFRT